MKSALSTDSIKELLVLLKDNFLYTKKQKDQSSLAKFLKYPQIPSALSESFALHLVRRRVILGHLKGFDFKPGKIADIVGFRDQKILRIEVKATSKSAFQRFGRGDIVSDYLIWIHFDNFFLDEGQHEIQIFVIEEPGKYFKRPGTLTLDDFKNKSKGLKSINFKITDL